MRVKRNNNICRRYNAEVRNEDFGADCPNADPGALS